jgi:hypothetical protein
LLSVHSDILARALTLSALLHSVDTLSGKQANEKINDREGARAVLSNPLDRRRRYNSVELCSLCNAIVSHPDQFPYV